MQNGPCAQDWNWSLQSTVWRPARPSRRGWASPRDWWSLATWLDQRCACDAEQNYQILRSWDDHHPNSDPGISEMVIPPGWHVTKGMCAQRTGANGLPILISGRRESQKRPRAGYARGGRRSALTQINVLSAIVNEMKQAKPRRRSVPRDAALKVLSGQ
jgi:hypothetical protein